MYLRKFHPRIIVLVFVIGLAFVGLPIWYASAYCAPDLVKNTDGFIQNLARLVMPSIAQAESGPCPKWVRSRGVFYNYQQSNLKKSGNTYYWDPATTTLNSAKNEWLYVYNTTNDTPWLYYSLDGIDKGGEAIGNTFGDRGRYHPTQCTSAVKGKTLAVDPGEEGGTDYLYALCN